MNKYDVLPGAKESELKLEIIKNDRSKPFTTKIIRDGIIRVSTGVIDHSELAEELNTMAFNFYIKSK